MLVISLLQSASQRLLQTTTITDDSQTEYAPGDNESESEESEDSSESQGDGDSSSETSESGSESSEVKVVI